MDDSEILPSVYETLAFIKEKNQFIALGSASKNARPILEKVNLLHFFDAVVDGNDVTNAKPDPEVFLQAAKLVGVSPENCIVFEDSQSGIKAANIANMLSVGIGEQSVLKEAQFCFPNFLHMDTSFIETLIKK